MSRAKLSFGVLSITVAMLGTAAAQPAGSRNSSTATGRRWWSLTIRTAPGIRITFTQPTPRHLRLMPGTWWQSCTTRPTAAAIGSD